MNLYIADTHFGHKNILLHDHRPFADTEEMWAVMKELWNGRVDKKDDVWIIGDFCFWNAQEDPVRYLRALKGKKHLIIGNHDGRLVKNDKAMSYFESVDYIKKIHDNGKTIIMCHYPLAEWDGFFRGSIHIYGHIHSSKNDAFEFMKKYDNALNAGCMINNYTPASLNELIRNNDVFKTKDRQNDAI